MITSFTQLANYQVQTEHQIDTRFNKIETRLDQTDTLLNRIETLLTQILAGLPNQP
jgi:hypothetical protein